MQRAIDDMDPQKPSSGQSGGFFRGLWRHVCRELCYTPEAVVDVEVEVEVKYSN